MRAGGKILACIFKKLAPNIKPGVTTLELDRFVRKEIEKVGGYPSFLGYRTANKHSKSYPAAICASVNDVVVHGIPSEKKLKSGDIVGIDIGLKFKGLHTDAAKTFGVGNISQKDKKLIRAAILSFWAGVKKIKEGVPLGTISWAICQRAESLGFSVVRDLSGHGIGQKLHEPPNIPNFGKVGEGIILKAGYVLAIEPMVNERSYHVRIDPDGWSVRTCDLGKSAHFEHTVLVTKKGYEILTKE